MKSFTNTTCQCYWSIIVRIGGIFAWFWCRYNGGFTRLGSLPHPKFDYRYLKVRQVYTLVNVLKFGSVCHLVLLRCHGIF